MSRQVNCRRPAPSSNPADKMSAANGTLSYNAMTGLYTYLWKTDKMWSGKCQILIVQLDDGTQHLAYFRFK
jgi:hypothetical protein